MTGLIRQVPLYSGLIPSLLCDTLQGGSLFALPLQVKGAFTRTYNKERHALPFAVPEGKKVVRRKASETSYFGEEEEEEEEEEEIVPVKPAPKARTSKAKAKVAGGSQGSKRDKGKGKGRA